MIISEVLDAIDNINSITIESEISMCESLLNSYDKMLIIEENYNGNDINDFKIFQEASKMDLVKEDVKNQNKGKSTLNKIIFTIPRLIRSLLRLIMGKLTPSKIKEGKETAEKMTDTAKNMSQEQIKDFNKVFDTKTSSKDRKAAAASLFGKIAVGGVLAVGTTIAATKAVKKIKSNKNDKKKQHKQVLSRQDIERSELTAEELKEISETINGNISKNKDRLKDEGETNDDVYTKMEKQKKQPVIDLLLKDDRITNSIDEVLKLVNENKDKIGLYENNAKDILKTIGNRKKAIEDFNEIYKDFFDKTDMLENTIQGIVTKMDIKKQYDIYPELIRTNDLLNKKDKESIKNFEQTLNVSNNYLRNLKDDLDDYLKDGVNGEAGYAPGHTYSIKDENIFEVVDAFGKDIKTYNDLLKTADQEANKSRGDGGVIFGPSRFVYIEGNGADADVYCDIWPMDHVNDMKYYLDIIKKINTLCKETKSVIRDGDINNIEKEVKNKSSNRINKQLFSEVYKEYEKAVGELKKIEKELADAHDELQKNLDAYKFDTGSFSFAVGRIEGYLNKISEPAKKLASMLKVIQDIERFCFILYSRFDDQSNTNSKLASTMKHAAEKYEKEHTPKND